MKKTASSILILFLLIVYAGCGKSPNEPETKLFTVSGSVLNSQGPVNNVKVSVDNALNWTVTTSPTGEFQIQNVSEGKHDLYIEQINENESFVEKSTNISVYSDINLDALLLPRPVLLYDPLDISMSTIKLTWDATDADDFYEYKLFRRDTPGLDETTGELIYVSTNRNDTTFTDKNLLSQQTYYYRVYLMNQYGRLGGSNIVNAQTIVGNLIPDGEFEDLNSLIQNWNISRGSGSNYITTLDDNIKMEGYSALYNRNPKAYTDGAINTYTMLTLNKPVNLVPQITYKLSGWFKARGKFTDIGSVFVDVNQNQTGLAHLMFNPDWSADSIDVDWTYKETTFFTSNTGSVEILIYLPIEEVWIDGLTLKQSQ